MDYIRAYRKFIYGYNFGHGLQTAFCIILPSLLGFYLDRFTFGILISLGALCVSGIDIPGPPRHRRNALLLGAACVLVSALAMSFYFVNEWLGDLVLIGLVFALSMTAVYGNRVTNIGLAGIYALVLVTEGKLSLEAYLTHAGLFFLGAIWYSFISLITYSLRPYQLIQQALSDCIYKTAEYLRFRAGFYELTTDFDQQFDKLIKIQSEVTSAQEVVRNLLLQRWNINQESTSKGRSLLLILIDTIDILEQVMAAHIDTQELHRIFDSSAIMNDYRTLILGLAAELDEIAVSVGSGRPSLPKTNFKRELELLQQKTWALRPSLLNEHTLGAFINLRNVRKNILLIAEKTRRLHRYTRMNGEGEVQSIELSRFVVHEDHSWQKMKSNLGPHSMYFRHAVRVSVAVAAALLIAEIFHVQRAYWILFTIVVILKPGFSLSKTRNNDRLVGTLFGGIFTVLILLFIKSKAVLLGLLILCMVITYSFVSINYALSTFTTTCFVLIFFNLLKPGDFSFLKLRLIDTGIGSALSFISSYFIFPVWEFQHIDSLLVKMNEANINYYISVAKGFTEGEFDEFTYKMARKEVYISSGNLFSAFQRMLTEPKSKQQQLDPVHQYTVLSHELSSHIASLASYYGLYKVDSQAGLFNEIMQASLSSLADATGYLEFGTGAVQQPDLQKQLPAIIQLEKDLDLLSLIRVLEIREGREISEETRPLTELKLVSDQFRFIYKLSGDIRKVSRKISFK